MISLSFLNLGVDIFPLFSCPKLAVNFLQKQLVNKRDPTAGDASHTGRENERDGEKRRETK